VSLMKLDIASLESPEFVQSETLYPPNNPYQPDYEETVDKEFEGQRVRVDNHHFRNCTFRRCNLIYSGGLFGFVACRFDASTRLSLTGSAARAVALWQSIAMHPDTGSWVGRALETYGFDE
jgi:hypothetical protein